MRAKWRGGGCGTSGTPPEAIGGRLAASRRSVPLPTLPTGSNPVNIVLPVARVTDMLMNPGEGYDFNGKRLQYPDVRLMYWCGGNAFHQQQDLNRLVKAGQISKADALRFSPNPHALEMNLKGIFLKS